MSTIVSMRENLAQAMCHAYGYDWDVLKESDDKISIRSRAGWRSIADAALSALETPDEGMVEAGVKMLSRLLDEPPPRSRRSTHHIAETFKAMIRKAQEDGK